MSNYNYTCFEIKLAGFPIKLEQSRKKGKLFTVTYGAQINRDLSYSEGCEKLGQVIFHALSLDSKVDNSGD